MSIALPMETLPHWPEVVEPSLLELGWVILGIPILCGLIIALLVWGPNLARLARGGHRGGAGSFWVNPGTLRTKGIDTDEDDAPYTVGERESLIRAVRRAEKSSALHFSVYVGSPEGRAAEDFAIDLLDSLPEPERSVLIYWDPKSEALEFVTGDETDQVITGSDLAQATAEVRSSAEQEAPVDGLIRAIDLLAEHGRAPAVLHSDRSLAVTS